MLFCVGEDHGAAPGPSNCLVRIDLDGGGAPVVVASGHDFYAAPRLAPRGDRLTWIAWRHPEMPWDGTELWVAEVDASGTLRDARRVAGGRDDAVVEPLWTPDGGVQFVSDRSGWWNLYRLEGAGVHPLCPRDAEFARPPWLFGFAHHAVLDDGAVACAFAREGAWHLGRVDPRTGVLDEVPTPYTDIMWLRAVPGGVVFVGASPVAAPCVVRLDVATGACAVLRHATSEMPDAALVSEPQPFAFPSAAGRVAHGLTTRQKSGPHGSGGRPASADRALSRRPDRRRVRHARRRHPVLDQQRLRGGRRRLRGQQRLRAGLPAAAPGRVGRGGRGGLRGGRPLRGRPRLGRSATPRRPGLERGRLHRAVRPGVPRRVRRRRELLWHRRPRGAARGDAQVRVALRPGSDRPLPGTAGPRRGALAAARGGPHPAAGDLLPGPDDARRPAGRRTPWRPRCGRAASASST